MSLMPGALVLAGATSSASLVVSDLLLAGGAFAAFLDLNSFRNESSDNTMKFSGELGVDSAQNRLNFVG